jgi:stalled ribosome rescue protein Dom34
VKLLEGAREILVVGPGTAKLELIKYIHRHHRDLEARVVGVETVDHPSDGQLLGYARHYFEAKDRMIG